MSVMEPLALHFLIKIDKTPFFKMAATIWSAMEPLALHFLIEIGKTPFFKMAAKP